MATSQASRVIRHVRGAVLLRDGAGLTDGQLLGRFLEHRDEAAFAAIVNRHGPMVWGVCRRLLTHHDAEDAFQAAFLVLARKAASILPREMAANWLYGVARQTALQARRTAARRKARERQVTEMPEPEAALHDVWDDVQPLLDQELGDLPDKYRAVIVLCDLEGKTRKETARQLGCPEGTVAGRLVRARAMLARRLARRGVVLSVGSLAAAPTPAATAPCAPPSIVTTTIKAATAFAAGRTAPAGLVSAKAAAFAEGVLKTMLLTKLKAVTVVLLLALGAMGLAYGMLPGGQAKAQNQERGRELVVSDSGGLTPALVEEAAGQGAKGQTLEDNVRRQGPNGTTRGPGRDARDDKARVIEGVVMEVDEKQSLLTSGERALLDERTEFLRETGLDAAPAKLSDVTSRPPLTS